MEKYNAYILKHKALILKYVPYVFLQSGLCFFHHQKPHFLYGFA